MKAILIILYLLNLVIFGAQQNKEDKSKNDYSTEDLVEILGNLTSSTTEEITNASNFSSDSLSVSSSSEQFINITTLETESFVNQTNVTLTVQTVDLWSSNTSNKETPYQMPTNQQSVAYATTLMSTNNINYNSSSSPTFRSAVASTDMLTTSSTFISTGGSMTNLSTSKSSTNPVESKKVQQNSNIGLIVGIAIGGFFLGFLFAIIICCVVRRRRNQKDLTPRPKLSEVLIIKNNEVKKIQTEEIRKNKRRKDRIDPSKAGSKDLKEEKKEKSKSEKLKIAEGTVTKSGSQRDANVNKKSLKNSTNSLSIGPSIVTVMLPKGSPIISSRSGFSSATPLSAATDVDGRKASLELYGINATDDPAHKKLGNAKELQKYLQERGLDEVIPLQKQRRRIK